MKSMIMYVLLLAAISASATHRYTPDWESLDKRPTPAWFAKAKFGIFIHWGLYSVPMWSPKGTYAEWYQYWLERKSLFGNSQFKGDEVYQYHKKTYGEDFAYQDFAPMFQAHDYDADQWVDLFQRAGAKYVVLTAKHHDGFALWPSKEASQTYARPWNSAEIGAHRDLVGEYVRAMRKRGLKVGCYFSLREWDNPLYHPQTMDIYYERHFFPQLQDLVSTYRPDVLWVDGPEGYDDKTWQVGRTLAWLYSDAPVKDSIVVNDRWASNTGKKHGDFYTTEYAASANNHFTKPWEECRGIGFSFGLNQNEDLEDYSRPESLIYTLINVVSQGGNLLLDIGPNANGKIPPIMQERLLQIGQWLRVNGEAIYDTQRWIRPCQWSTGNRDYKPKSKMYVGGNEILKQTVDPEPGYAVKEIFFTHKGKTLYAIVPQWPSTQLVIKDIKVNKHAKISILGTDKLLKWKRVGDNVIVTVPRLYYDELPCQYAWTFRIDGVTP